MENLPVLITVTISGNDLVLRIDPDRLCEQPQPSRVIVVTLSNCRDLTEAFTKLNNHIGRIIEYRGSPAHDSGKYVEFNIDYTLDYFSLHCADIRVSLSEFSFEELHAKARHLSELYRKSEDALAKAEIGHRRLVERLSNYSSQELARCNAKQEYYHSAKPEMLKVLDARAEVCNRVLRLLSEGKNN